MIKFIDDFLNGITMYRLMSYYLILLIVVAGILALFKILPFSLIDLAFSTTVLVFTSWIANTVLAKIFKSVTNVESFFITALILTLIISPVEPLGGLPFLIWAAGLAMASKYVLAIKKKHIFNPAAFAVAFTAITINKSASWWVGSLPMLPFVLVGGLLIARKLRRLTMVGSFFAVSILAIIVFSIFRNVNLLTILKGVIFYSQIWFFAFVMFTEPLTTPPTQTLRIIYGVIVGFLYALPFRLGSIFFTPETALLLGNVYSYLVSPKIKLILRLKKKMKIARDTYEFLFVPDRKVAFLPGQYMEWTLGHKNPDSRGNRRYFTLASSPAEKNIRIGVKIPNPSSTFKKALLSIDETQKIVAGQLSGDFTLPKDPNKKLVFLAGGIGITPFRSMIKYLLDTNQKRQITLLYFNRVESDVAYRKFLDQAIKKMGIKVIYWNTSTQGYLHVGIVKKEIPDFQERIFYLSGPNSMVISFQKLLKELGIKERFIKTDFFPGY